MYYNLFLIYYFTFTGWPAKVPGLNFAFPHCLAVFVPQKTKNQQNKQIVIRSLTSLMVIPV